MARPEYEAIVKVVYEIDNSEMKKVTEPTKGKTVTINVDTDSKSAEKDIKKLKTDLNELKKILGSAGDGADFTKIVKQLNGAIKEINVLSRAMKNFRSDSDKPIGLDIDVVEIQKIMNFAKTFESSFEGAIESINNRINGLVESIGNIKPPDISSRNTGFMGTAEEAEIIKRIERISNLREKANGKFTGDTNNQRLIKEGEVLNELQTRILNLIEIKEEFGDKLPQGLSSSISDVIKDIDVFKKRFDEIVEKLSGRNVNWSELKLPPIVGLTSNENLADKTDAETNALKREKDAITEVSQAYRTFQAEIGGDGWGDHMEIISADNLEDAYRQIFDFIKENKGAHLLELFEVDENYDPVQQTKATVKELETVWDDYVKGLESKKSQITRFFGKENLENEKQRIIERVSGGGSWTATGNKYVDELLVKLQGVEGKLVDINEEKDRFEKPSLNSTPMDNFIQKQIEAVKELKSELASIEDPFKTPRSRDVSHIEKYGEDGSRTLEQQQAIKDTLEERERVLLRIATIVKETPEALPVDEQKKYNTELKSTRVYLEQVNSMLQKSSVQTPSDDVTAPEATSMPKVNAETKEHIELMEEAAKAELEKLEISKKLAGALLDEEGALKAVGKAAEDAEKKTTSGKSRSSKSSATKDVSTPVGLEFSIGIPEDEKQKILSWFTEVKGIAENIQSISISPNISVEDGERQLVGYSATVKQLDDETKQITSSTINLNAELGDADGSWNRFSENIKSASGSAKEFNAEFQRSLATQQIETLKATLGNIPFEFQKVEEASKNIVDRKSLEDFNNQLKLTKEEIRTVQAGVKNEQSLQVFTTMEKNLEKIPIRIEVLQERIKKFASVEGFDKVNNDIIELGRSLERANEAKNKGDTKEFVDEYGKLTSAISRVREEMQLLSARKSSGNLSPVANETTLEIQALFDLLKEADSKFSTVSGKSSEAKDKVDKLVASFRELNLEGVDSKLVSNFEDLAKKLEVKFDFGLSDGVSSANKEFISNFERDAKAIYNTKIVNDEQFDVAKTKLDALSNKLKEAQELGITGDKFRGLQDVFTRAKASVDGYDVAVEKASNTLGDLKLKLDKLKKDNSKALLDPNFSKQIQDLESKIANLTDHVEPGPVKNLVEEFNRLNLSIKASDASGQSFAHGIESTFKRLTQYVISNVIVGGLRNQISGIISSIDDLDRAMTNLQVVTGWNNSQAKEGIKLYNQYAKELGVTTQSVMEGADSWLRQGKAVKETNQLIQDSTMFARIAQIDTTEATELLTAALNGYTLQAEDAIKITDMFNAVDLVAATSAAELGKSFQFVAASAKDAGISQEKLTALLAVSSEKTRLSAETIGTMWKTLISRMSNVKAGKFIDDETGEDLNTILQVLKKVEIEVINSNGVWRDFGDVFDEIGSKWETFNQTEQNAISTALASTRQANIFRATMESYGDVLSYTEVAQNSAGTTMEKFGVIMDSIDYKVNNLKESLVGIWQNVIGSDIAKGFLDLGNVVTTAFGAADGLLTKIVGYPAAIVAAFGILKTIKGTELFGNIQGISAKLLKPKILGFKVFRNCWDTHHALGNGCLRFADY